MSEEENKWSNETKRIFNTINQEKFLKIENLNLILKGLPCHWNKEYRMVTSETYSNLYFKDITTSRPANEPTKTETKNCHF